MCRGGGGVEELEMNVPAFFSQLVHIVHTACCSMVMLLGLLPDIEPTPVGYVLHRKVR